MDKLEKMNKLKSQISELTELEEILSKGLLNNASKDKLHDNYFHSLEVKAYLYTGKDNCKYASDITADEDISVLAEIMLPVINQMIKRKKSEFNLLYGELYY